jgi:Uma2 family endonuclease
MLPARAKPLELPLEEGDCVLWPEFERRAALTPERKLELIDGVVYVGPPVSFDHGAPHSLLNTWLGVYSASTRGTAVVSDTTLRLDMKNAPQPDVGMCIRREAGGRLRLDEKGYIVSGIELVVEVAKSTSSKDLHKKKDAYQTHGCLEYIVYVLHTREVHWFVQEESGYVALEPDERGVMRSRVFPGLWLDSKALVAIDGARVLETLREGLATKEHAAFAAALGKQLDSSSA